MEETPILDEPALSPSLHRRRKIQKIFTLIELSLWGLYALFFGMRKLGVLNAESLYIVLFDLLLLFYLFCTIPLMGSEGWKRHVGSLLAGLVLVFSFMPVIFVSASWEGARELVLISLLISAFATVVGLLLYFVRKGSPRGNRFFQGIWVRTALGLAINLILWGVMR